MDAMAKHRPWIGALLAGTSLALGPVGCSPQPSAPPNRPAAAPAPAPLTEGPARPEAEASAPPPANRLERSLASARDLFNRGENDLACEQVAIAVREQAAGAAAPPPDLERYQQACQGP
jgi:hypothetical protein